MEGASMKLNEEGAPCTESLSLVNIQQINTMLPENQFFSYNKMKLNAKTQIIGNQIILVPYRIKHVEKYHKWMEDEELRNLTASERLSLDEEYKMQQTWLHDENKCTFIVLDKSTMKQSQEEIESMIGDANLYLKKTEDGLVGEIGLMVADSKFRGKGIGKEIAVFLMRYASTTIKVDKFEAIISLSNERSIKMFKNFGFEQESLSTVFNEITLCKKCDDKFIEYLLLNSKDYSEMSTEENK